MPKIAYGDQKVLSPGKRRMIAQANEIIAEYASQGLDLTLRQLYYQFVARDIIPNKQTEYKRLGDVIADGRLAGLVDWHAIVDRTRFVRSLSHWDGPADVLNSAAVGYRTDRWDGQPYRPEVWIEKDALVGVIAGVCERYDVPYFSCRGYTSLSEMWSAGRRLRSYVLNNQTPMIFHFGDHDPSGMDMTRDIRDRLSMFSNDVVEVERLALNFNQIQEFNPPPNPAKLTDSRANAYVAEFGDESWELDALDPRRLASLIETSITALIERGPWGDAEMHDADAKKTLAQIAARYEDVKEFLEA